MKQEIPFSETQAFRQVWIWLLLGGLVLFMAYGMYQQLAFGLLWGDRPMSDPGLILTVVLMQALLFLFGMMRLETRIDALGVHARFFPFHWRFRDFPWDDLVECRVRRYSPIAEYGGWGLRIGFFGRGSAWNVSGDQGLQLVFRDGRQLLIGTRRPKELEAALDRFMHRDRGSEPPKA